MPNRLLLALSSRPSLRRLIASKPYTRSVVDRFVAGESVDDAIKATNKLIGGGATAILDYLGEHVASPHQADEAAASYLECLNRIEQEAIDAHVSVKLTQLGLDLSIDDCAGRMEKLCARAAEIGTMVAIDMESHEHTGRTIEVFRGLRHNHTNLVLCLQAYLRRTPADVDSLLTLEPAVRLCKGAYNEPRELAWGRSKTNSEYKKLLEKLLDHTGYTAIATHDSRLVAHAIEFTKSLGIGPDRFEFQMLYGVRRDLQAKLTATGYRVRVYVPYGDEWYPYLMRRLAERPANLRFFLEALLRG